MPRANVIPIVIISFAALAAAPAAAQDVVHLKSGETLAGKTADGMLALEVETATGTVRVPWANVDKIDRASFVTSLYETRAKEADADDAAAQFLLARWCRRHGLGDQMKTHLERVVKLDPEHAAARQALGQEKIGEKWVAGDAALEAKGFVKKDGRWLLKEEAAYEEILKARAKGLSEPEEKAADLIVKCVDENPRIAKYAAKSLDGKLWEDVRIPLYRALGHRKPALRAFAAAELGRRKIREAVRPLIRTAILDREEKVRHASVDALRSLGEPKVLFPFARALASGCAAIRQNAAVAMGRLGDVRGIEYLVKRLSQSWGPSNRGNIQVMNQISYIQDF
ncbi:MAG: HEAT repeat domain-containing protein, partial [Planctomycetota bacterium]